jgi:serine/threonine protein kinase
MSNKLGEGTFGIVYTITENDTTYALKRNLAETESSFLSTIRELNILYLLRQHPNIVKLEGVIFGEEFGAESNKFSPLIGEDRTTQKNDNVHFLFQQGKCDLHDYIYDDQHVYNYIPVKKYMVDMLMGLEYMHHYKLLHRDIKPGNILLFENGAKICDFGFSKPHTTQGEQTPGVVTVCYRAPEILLSCPTYDYKIDIWSMGCVFFELISQQLFITETKNDDAKLLKCILHALPVPLKKDEFKKWIALNEDKKFKMRNMIQSKPESFTKKLNLSKNKLKLFKKNCGNIEEFDDLLTNMLKFNHLSRYSATDCLNHKFFAEYKEIIEDTRERYNGDLIKHKILFPICKEREWVAQTVECLWNNKQSLEWYSNRCLFQAIDIFHRYLYTMYQNSEPNVTLHDEFKTNLLFMACIYICIKLFSSLHYSMMFSSVVQEEFLTEECMKIVEAFEGGLIVNCFKYDIYHDTIYEAADICNDTLGELEIKNLLYLFTTNNYITDKYPEEVYRAYRKIIKWDSQELLLSDMF